ncbi:MAG: hypothetical protein ACK5ML_07210 [Lachnospiraceae bacterium]
MIIGLIGSSRGCGVTTLAMALALYCSSGQKRKTVFLDFSGNSQLLHLGEDQMEGGFWQQGIYIRPGCLPEQFTKLIQNEFQYTIIDFGNHYRTYKEELFLCDTIITIADLSIFHMWEYDEMKRETGAMSSIHKDFRCFLAHISRDQRRDLTRIPYIRNPLVLQAVELDFLHSLLPAAARRQRKRKALKIFCKFRQRS